MKLGLPKFLFRSNWVLAPSGGADTRHLKPETKKFWIAINKLVMHLYDKELNYA